MSDGKKQGFMLYHDDLKLALAALDDTQFKNLFRFLLAYSKAGSWVDKQKAYDYAKNPNVKVYAEFFAEKIDRDSEKYSNRVKENSIKGLMSALKREYTALSLQDSHKT